MKILLDNGHGIDTPGKRSPDGLLREYAWNRLIASRIVTALTDLGHDAAPTTPTPTPTSRKTSNSSAIPWLQPS